MIVVLSGEGSSDIGGSNNGSDRCDSGFFRPGPMAHFIDRFINEHLQYSVIDAQCIRWISRNALAAVAKRLRIPSISLPGARSEKGFLMQRKAAAALGRFASDLETSENDVALAILFHDSDGTQVDSANRWESLVHALEQGFGDVGFDRGVCMVPKPKQEAWLLCAVKDAPYEHCHLLEDESGNDTSPQSLKRQLAIKLGGATSTDDMVELVLADRVNPLRIEMPSLAAFKVGLERAISRVRNVGAARAETL